MILDAGTGFGITTLEITKRVSLHKSLSRIISVDIDLQPFDRTRKLLVEHKLSDLATFVKADLSNMPQINTESVDLVISTHTISEINSFPSRITIAIREFHRVLKKGGQVILSDELPILKAMSDKHKVAVTRWQLAKAISHLIGRPHANEVEPEDLEFTMKLVGFQECKWAVFKGEIIPRRRIDYLFDKATDMTTHIDNLKLRKAFVEAIEIVRKTFDAKGGVFPPRYIVRAKK